MSRCYRVAFGGKFRGDVTSEQKNKKKNIIFSQKRYHCRVKIDAQKLTKLKIICKIVVLPREIV